MNKLLFMKLKIENYLANYHYYRWSKYCHNGLGIYEDKPYANLIRRYCEGKAVYHLKRMVKYQNKVLKSCEIIRTRK